MGASALALGEHVPELRPNAHPQLPMLVIRDRLGRVREEIHFNPSQGIVISFDDLLKGAPADQVLQVAVIPPGGGDGGRGNESIILPTEQTLREALRR